MTRSFPRIAALTAAAMLAVVPTHAPIAQAQQVPANPENAGYTETPAAEPAPWEEAAQKYGDKIRVEQVYSPSMKRTVPVIVIPARTAQRPTLYLLSGADGGEGSMNWVTKTDAVDFYADKDVNVVLPMAGKLSYYTNWNEPAEQLGGAQQWETFLTKELPGVVEKKYNANGKRAIAGMSMSATSSILLAQHNPGFYNAVGSFSGCAETNTQLGQFALMLTLARANAKPEQMWGPINSPTRLYNDPMSNVAALRGTELYVSNGSGLAGRWDLWSSPFVTPELNVATHVINGGVIESVSNICTHNFKAKLDANGIPATFRFNNNGTHSWGYWQDELRNSWPTIARGLGL